MDLGLVKKSLVLYLAIILTHLIIPRSVAQCNSNLILLLSNQYSSEVITFQKGKKLEIITTMDNVTGKLNCVKSHKIKVNKKWIKLQDINLIIDPNERIRWNDALAWPVKVTGILIGGLGVGLTLGSGHGDDIYNQNNNNRRDRQQLVGGLVLTAIGAGLTYSGIAMSSKERVNNDIYYSCKRYRYVTIDKSQVANYKKRMTHP